MLRLMLRVVFATRDHTGVYENTLLLRKPLPCSPAAETAPQPLIWCSESQSSNVYSFPEECFCSRTPVALPHRPDGRVRSTAPPGKHIPLRTSQSKHILELLAGRLGTHLGRVPRLSPAAGCSAAPPGSPGPARSRGARGGPDLGAAPL